MTISEQEEHFNKLIEKMRTTMLKKGNDYSTKDRLGIFKVVAGMCNVTPLKVCQIMMCLKIQRMINLTDQGLSPENESVQDTSVDLACYAILSDAILNEPK